MESVLTKLYNGEIYPAEQVIPTNPHYTPLWNKISEEVKYLKEKLNPEDAKRLDDLDNTYSEAIAINSAANFSYGYRLGTLIAIEAFTTNDKLIRNTEE